MTTRTQHARGEEIERLLVMVRCTMLAFPELRLGQIIGNVLPRNYQNDPYYIPDAELCERLRGFLNTNGYSTGTPDGGA